MRFRAVYQAIAALRRALGDDPKSPTYIASVPRRGYRLVAPIFEEVNVGDEIRVQGNLSRYAIEPGRLTIIR